MRKTPRRLLAGLLLALLVIPAVRALPPGMGDRDVKILSSKLTDLQQIALTADLAAVRFGGVLLWESDDFAEANKQFLQAYKPAEVSDPMEDWPAGESLVGEKPFTRAVICRPEPRSLLLHAANLAGAIRARLFILTPQNEAKVRKHLKEDGFRDLFVVGTAKKVCTKLPKALRVHEVLNETDFLKTFLAYRLSKIPVKTLVIANPHDLEKGGMSTLAPWIAYQKKALLLLTNEAGTNVKQVVDQALENSTLDKVDSIILAGNLKALPMERRPNPVKGGRDAYIEMEPLTPAENQAHSFAVGRLFHPDPAVVALMLARPRLFPKEVKDPPKVLVVSNPGGGLPFLETLSRNTVQEFRNAGYTTKALIGSKASRSQVRKLLPDQTIFLWEGHFSTLFREYEVHRWTEPLQPSLIFLQSCLALAEDKTHHFLERGSVGIIGSTSRTYSGSGGAFSLAYFDSLVYDRQSVGALRHAKNFMLAFAMLKEKRLGEEAKLGGANVRASWAFTLWGDPTLQLPRPTTAPKDDAVTHQVRGNTISITLPPSALPKVSHEKFTAAMSPNARLAGLIRVNENDQHQLVPLVFIEVSLPKAPTDKTPQLRSRLPEKNWVFSWDSRRRCGYLLVTPRNKDQGELRFQVDWN